MSFLRRLGLIFVGTVLLGAPGCDSGQAADGTPATPPSLSGTAAPTASPAPTAPSVPTLPGGLSIGRFQGSGVCLELFENGDAHLNDIQSGPKVQVLGRLSLAAAAKGEVVQAEFEVARIWKGRWTSSCRKHHELGGWTDSVGMLGHTFEVGTHPLTLRSIDQDSVELCAKNCKTLKRQPTLLHGRWRVAGLSGGGEGTDAALDEVIDLDVDEHGGAWLSLGPDRKWAMLSGPMSVEFLGGDRFAIKLDARMVDTGAGVATAPDSNWKPGAHVELSAQRLPGERMRVCRSEAEGSACTELERMFDAYDHDVH